MFVSINRSMARAPDTSAADLDTRHRLLDAAGEVFAEAGFRAATVRAICARANANVAAVNYHFGDKETLYHDVLAHAHRAALERYPPDLGLRAGATAEEALHAYVRAFLMRLLSDGVPAWLGKLMAREMIEPTAAIERIVEHTARPMFERLIVILREIAGADLPLDVLTRCAQSVVGQCLFYRHCREIIRRGWPDADPTPERIDELAEHITRFSIAGIEARARQAAPSRARRLP
jgi:TetR/AcrR family transcriptional regulator, regulator of cefoperazone and chloramphenicol sensitivity